MLRLYKTIDDILFQIKTKWQGVIIFINMIISNARGGGPKENGVALNLML